MNTTLPTDSAARKAIPITTGVLDYFPAALAAVAMVSKAGNDKHNPGQPLHHSRGKSTDHADSVGRHLLERGGIDPDTGQRHSAEMAWRALALLQQELEDAGEAPMARAASYDDPDIHEDVHAAWQDKADLMRGRGGIHEAHGRWLAMLEERQSLIQPTTPADLRAREAFNLGIEMAATILDQQGFEGLGEDVRGSRA